MHSHYGRNWLHAAPLPSNPAKPAAGLPPLLAQRPSDPAAAAPTPQQAQGARCGEGVRQLHPLRSWPRELAAVRGSGRGRGGRGEGEWPGAIRPLARRPPPPPRRALVSGAAQSGSAESLSAERTSSRLRAD